MFKDWDILFSGLSSVASSGHINMWCFVLFYVLFFFLPVGPAWKWEKNSSVPWVEKDHILSVDLMLHTALMMLHLLSFFLILSLHSNLTLKQRKKTCTTVFFLQELLFCNVMASYISLSFLSRVTNFKFRQVFSKYCLIDWTGWL